jgi:hypothetical protein
VQFGGYEETTASNLWYFTLNMEVLHSSETVVYMFQTTRCHNPEGHKLTTSNEATASSWHTLSNL